MIRVIIFIAILLALFYVFTFIRIYRKRHQADLSYVEKKKAEKLARENRLKPGVEALYDDREELDAMPDYIDREEFLQGIRKQVAEETSGSASEKIRKFRFRF